MQTIAVTLVVWGLLHVLGLFTLSRVRRHQEVSCPDLRVMILIPALNEARVISATIDDLLTISDASILVIDDASDDNTACIASTFADDRVKILRRELPNARQGKGEALNAALRWISGNESGVDPDRTVIGVFDADGRLQHGALPAVRAAFSDPRVGGVQISVRIRNRADNFWTRMQHFEFVSFTALFQRGREHTGGVGLGGNGQFARLSALQSLGANPWSKCLTEDQDLGIRLLLGGWRNVYLPTTSVSQQAVPEFSRLARQRTRWFQGSLQCVAHIPKIMASRLRLRTKVDLICGLLSPLVMLVATPLVVIGWVRLAMTFGETIHGGSSLSTLLYAVLFVSLPAVALGYAFWIEEPSTTLPGAILLGHLFLAYSLLWMYAGWRALARQLTSRSSWAKTERVIESASPTDEVAFA